MWLTTLAAHDTNLVYAARQQILDCKLDCESVSPQHGEGMRVSFAIDETARVLWVAQGLATVRHDFDRYGDVIGIFAQVRRLGRYGRVFTSRPLASVRGSDGDQQALAEFRIRVRHGLGVPTPELVRMPV